MSRIRVISFGSVPPEWGGAVRGGVATFHATLVEAIQAEPDLGVEIIGVVTTGSGRGSAPVPTWVLEPGERRELFLDSLLAEVQPDIALLNHFSTGWGLSLPQVAPHLPLVGIAHSWHSITFGEDPEPARERMQRAMDHLAALVVPSEHALSEGLGLGLRYPDRTNVVRYPLSQAFSGPAALEHTRTGVLFAGELIARKNPSALLEAATLAGEIPILIVGEGADQGALRRTADQLGVGKQVRFLGALPPEELRREMERAEVFCLPSLSESFGIVYLEALACGTPVIGFGPTLQELARCVGVRIGVALPRTSPEAIAAAIEEIRSASWNRQVLRRVVLEAYRAADVAREYAAVLDTAATRR